MGSFHPLKSVFSGVLPRKDKNKIKLVLSKMVSMKMFPSCPTKKKIHYEMIIYD